MRMTAVGLWTVLCALAAMGCGDEETEKTQADAGSMDAGDTGQTDAASDGSEPAEGGLPEPPSSWCGDEVVDDLEECDDGNNDEWDGCNTLCEFTCSDDSDCDDMDVCNGIETCQSAEHVCESGDDAEDGTYCGALMSCNTGVCLPNACGDRIEQEGEECDDGDLDDENGCSSECTFTCVSDDSSRDCSGGDECAAAATCDDTLHVCQQAGSPAADKTMCDNGDGWCMKGVCVLFKCGDGILDPNEECDDGPDNGDKESSDCSIDCQEVRCGDDKIRGNEQCDDGNRVNLDGCDSNCRVEIVHRLTYMDVVKGPPPDFCAFQNNAFGSAFLGELNLSAFVPGAPTFNFTEMINGFLRSAISSGTTNSLIQTMDLADPSGRTTDDEVRLGVYSGVPDGEWQEGPPLDFPFLIEAEYVTENDQPAAVVPARLAGSGLLITTEPTDVTVRSPMGKFEMLKTMARSVFDIDSLSTPEAPPQIASSVKIPEAFGKGDPAAEPYRPQGVLCGAISTKSLAEIPVPPMPCCPDATVRTERYRVCEGAALPPDCDSMLEVFRNGCDIYPLLMQMPGGGPPQGPPNPDEIPDQIPDGGIPDFSFECGTRQPGEFYISMIYATEPDVDADGDGTRDGYSIVIGYEGNRAKITGVQGR